MAGMDFSYRNESLYMAEKKKEKIRESFNFNKISMFIF